MSEEFSLDAFFNDAEIIDNNEQYQLLRKSKQLTEYEKGWLEAAIDGEGTIAIRKRKTKPINPRTGKSYDRFDALVSISNLNIAFLQKAVLICNGGSIYKVERKEGREPAYLFYIYPTIIRRIIPQISLVIKEKQRLFMLDALPLLEKSIWRTTKQTRQLENICIEMAVLNRRGIRDLA